MKRHWRLSYAALLAMLPSFGATAQTASNGTAFGDWQLVCEAVAVNQTRCEIRQTLTLRQSGALLAQVALTPIAQTESTPAATALVLTTPTGMFLPMAPGLSIEDDETLPLQWRTCDANRCIASRILEPDEVEALRAGTRMTLGYRPAAATDAVIFPVSLQGVSAGLDALGE